MDATHSECGEAILQDQNRPPDPGLPGGGSTMGLSAGRQVEVWPTAQIERKKGGGGPDV